MSVVSLFSRKSTRIGSVLPQIRFSGTSTANQGKPCDTLPPSDNLPTEPPITPKALTKSSKHHVFAFGFAQTGALGRAQPFGKKIARPNMPRPVRLKFSELFEVHAVRAGFGFSIFYVETDGPLKIFGCGINTRAESSAKSPLVNHPVPLNIFLKPSTKLTGLSCGRAHVAFSTDNEGTFLFGSNMYGQCGKPRNSDEFTVNRLGFDDLVVDVDCGQDHSLLLTEYGKVYACGWGFQDALAVLKGDIEGERIIKTTGKSDTILAINGRGDVFGWGNNEFGQLVYDRDVHHVSHPRHLAHVNRICGPIADIAAGEGFCAAVNQKGDVFVWGWGILGGGPDLSTSQKPFLLPRPLFGCNQFQPQARTVRIYSGVSHLAAVNNFHHMYTWGQNRQGCLGIGHYKDQYFPYKVSLGGDTVDVSCGIDHTMVLCK